MANDYQRLRRRWSRREDEIHYLDQQWRLPQQTSTEDRICLSNEALLDIYSEDYEGSNEKFKVKYNDKPVVTAYFAMLDKHSDLAEKPALKRDYFLDFDAMSEKRNRRRSTAKNFQRKHPQVDLFTSEARFYLPVMRTYEKGSTSEDHYMLVIADLKSKSMVLYDSKLRMCTALRKKALGFLQQLFECYKQPFSTWVINEIGAL